MSQPSGVTHTPENGEVWIDFDGPGIPVNLTIGVSLYRIGHIQRLADLPELLRAAADKFERGD